MMMINRRRVCGGKSLPYDAEIEYLESQGSCAIYTGIVPTGTNITIKTKIYYIGYTNNDNWIQWFSAYTGEIYPTYRIIRQYSKNDIVIVNNSSKAGGGGTNVNVSPNTLYNIELYPGYGLINNSRFILSMLSEPVNRNPLILYDSLFKGRFYFFNMTDGDNVLLDLIPVRVGQVGYMYDKVSKQLFGNSGTGNFILGPDI